MNPNRWASALGLLLLAAAPRAQAFAGEELGPTPVCVEAGQPALRVALIHHGRDLSMTDLDRVWEMLAPRFLEATGCQLRLERATTRIVPLKSETNLWLIPREIRPIFGGKRWPRGLSLAERARLARLRYYYAAEGSGRIVREIRSIARRIPKETYDALVVLTAAQFEGLGFGLPNEMAVTEQPVEIAWAAQGGGETRFESDARVVDELIHELGHVIGLNHASFICNQLPEGLPFGEMERCCAESPSRNDVMSYCRPRSTVSDSFFFGFTECNRAKIRNRVIPALLAGRPFRYEAAGCD
ncbi:MAG: hypothetical protein IT285_08085 [Bdellovibrionales bacterium]|nr:hypothetical protein [Bdellovibrionales bacterium]